ncbi:unnamed protein product [Fraxinus pennsylvanica]|uniref:Uncharacterized protein n=1 Tax=Fraxinus pennsylvanica TaxID=56036 RepID=A0AAD2DZ82_9LAMI|nr:unnamed protein product [Fraxinus pennsylvanica]
MQKACHAVESNEGYQLYIKAIEEICEQIYRVNIGTKYHVETSPNLLDSCNEKRSQFALLDPNVSITKGWKKNEKGKGKDHVVSGRFKSIIELVQKKKHKYALCKESGHDTSIYPKTKTSGNDQMT